MSLRLEFSFELDPASAFEGMTLAGLRVFRGCGRWLLIVLFAAQSIVMPLGVIALYVMSSVLVRGDIPQNTWILIGFGLFGSLSIAVSGIVLIPPLSAFEDKAAMLHINEQVNELFEAGRGGV